MLTLESLPAEVSSTLSLCRFLSLLTLPSQLLYSIHLFSLSSSLPYTSRHLHQIFTHATIHHRAMYLTLSHPRKTLQQAILYPLCTLPVLHALERIAKTRKKILSCKELPSRLFKVTQLSRPNPRPEASPVDLPLITHLLTHYSADPSCVETNPGYPLARAVLGRHLPLIRLLLSFGADPSLGDDGEPVAVMVAIKRGDLEVVKMLLEREVVREEAVSEEEKGEGEVEAEIERKIEGRAGKKRRRSSSGGGGKRRRTDQPKERTSATPEMIAVAISGKSRAKRRPMVDYLTSRGELVSSLLSQEVAAGG